MGSSKLSRSISFAWGQTNGKNGTGAGSGIGKFDPDGRVITGPFAAAYFAVDAGSDKAAGNSRAQKQKVAAQTGVAAKGIPEIFPERVSRSFG